jgi:hypothetical protein
MTVSALLAQVSVPTPVMHSRDDARVPFGLPKTDKRLLGPGPASNPAAWPFHYRIRAVAF